jgi:branched-chain amino acid transport system substrate-binding protein
LKKHPRHRGIRILLALFLVLLLPGPAWTGSPGQPALPSQPDDTLLFREGEALLAKGDTERALWRFKTLTTDFPDSSLVNEAKFRMGLCYTQLKRPKEAIRTLNELFSTFLAPARMVQVFTLLGDNHVELKDPPSALQWYGKGLLVPHQPQEELKKKVKAIIDSFDTEDKLRQVESLYRGAYAGGYAKWKLAQMAKRRGDEAASRKILADLEKEYRGVDYGPPGKDVAEPIRPQAKAKYTVGIILPLSGIYQPFGERVLQGIQVAMKESEGVGRIPLTYLAIRDSKGDPFEAEKAVEDLIIREKAIVILGPLLTLTCEKAARKAQQLKTPMLNFSQREAPSGKDDFVFQNSLTPSSQVRTIANFAVKELELRTFGVFYPNSPYGLHFKQIFSQEVLQRGGKVIGAVSYQEDQTDFSQEIRVFFKIKSVTKAIGPQKKEEEFVSPHLMDGLFIPDTYQRVALILSQMGYYNIQGITLLGINGWNHPKLTSTGGRLVEGAFFVDAFSKGNASPSVEHFLKEFRKTYSREPETLEALGYDSAELVRDILAEGSVSTPAQMRDEIRKVQDFEGASGLDGFGEGGKAIRTLSILRVNKGQIEHFSP